ncbi:hypothetical protein EJ994_13340 [Maribacter sp. MJ134]|uniref:hypothetical protein n=1 Tax=Maribacter sp. MJ134 TaxID=2496865 RepID=UPI000F817C6F|nr:hypothetical protein [Maribacter sp. MJ134]AZQ59733.1 hypothetical protein EJ994_13340 [Maribacter sp. MJ134]
MTKPQNIIAQIRINVRKKPWKCLVDGCETTAINSHLIQQNGLLSNIATNGHLIELKLIDAYKWTKNQLPIQFKKVGIKQALSHKVFCNKHDTSIFEPIENNETDFKSYQSFLLFSYRAACAEIRKKLIIIEQHNRLINSSNLSGKIDKETLAGIIRGNELGIKDLRFLKNELEQEIKSNSEKFTFFSFSYPKIDLYASALFSTTDIGFERDDENLDVQNIYVHILPLESETLILIGYHNSYSSKAIENYCKSWKGLDEKNLEQKLTSLIVTNIENWGLSPELYSNLSKRNISKYIDTFRDNAHYFGIDKPVDFNLFEKK